MEFKSISKNLNGISTLFLWLKPDPFWIREWMCLVSFYFFEKISKSKNFKRPRKNKLFYRKRNNDFLMIERFLKLKIILYWKNMEQ